MSTPEQSDLQKIIDAFKTLSLSEMSEALTALGDAYSEKRIEAQALVRRLERMGIGVSDPLPPPLAFTRASKANPRYVSKVDPNLTWSGRGKTALWLQDEMEKTGLPKEAFEVPKLIET